MCKSFCIKTRVVKSLCLENEYKKRKHTELNQRYECIDNVIRSKPYDATTALRILQQCSKEEDVVDWTFLNSLLYGFGILTTLGRLFKRSLKNVSTIQFLGYGKIETYTTFGKIFTVIYGFIGVPVTVIILSNFGLYLRHLHKVIRLLCIHTWSNWRKSRIQTKNAVRLNESNSETDQDGISPLFLAGVVICYLVFGAIFMPLLNGRFDFVNGLYYCYICFTAIEFGTLIPTK